MAQGPRRDPKRRVACESILGDALQALKALPSASFDACITDPPYNMSRKKGLAWAFSSHVTMQEEWDRFTPGEYVTFCREWLREVCRVVRPNGNILVFGTFHNIYTTGAILHELDRRILNSIVWAKPNAQPNITCRTLTESTEQIVWACNETRARATGWTFNYAKAKRLNGGKQMRNFWIRAVTPRQERRAAHPTQKPLDLMEKLILLFTRKGDRVLDPFAGVGTTGLAAARHGRSCTLIEREARYVAAQRERFLEAGLAGVSLVVRPAKRSPASPKAVEAPLR